MCITRTVVRWGLVGALGLGAASLVLGPDRVSAGLAMIRGKAQHVIDSAISDPVALRRQLDGLSKQYPDRIAQVRGEMAEVTHQLAEFERDIEIAQRVVAMTTNDLGQLKTLVARAEQSAKDTTRPVAIRFDGGKFNIDEAYNEARRINNVRATFQDRLVNDQQQHQFLTEQKTRLSEILNKLESEYSTFQAQMWQLDRQIDSIERNNRLIELTEQQQATLASYEKFGKVGSLKQIEGKLAEMRAVQKAQLDTLAKRNVHTNYENKAEMDLNSNSVNENPFADLEQQPSTDQTIDIKPSDAPRDAAGKKMAFADPVVIE